MNRTMQTLPNRSATDAHPTKPTTTARARQEPCRRRPDHDAPLNGDHHGFDNSDCPCRDGKPRGGFVARFRPRCDPRPRSRNHHRLRDCRRDGHITSGTAEPIGPLADGGMRFLRFTRWLTDSMEQDGRLDLVVYEQMRQHPSADAAHAFGGRLATLTAWCEHHESPTRAYLSERSSNSSPARAMPTRRPSSQSLKFRSRAPSIRKTSRPRPPRSKSRTSSLAPSE